MNAGTPGPDVLREMALLFLKLGTTAFGGPAAHIAMMEDAPRPPPPRPRRSPSGRCSSRS